MKILLYIWSLSMGGAERHTIDLTSGLKRYGFDPTILVHDGSVSADLQADPDLSIISLQAGRFADPRGWIRAWAALRRLRCDLLVTVNPSATCVALAGRALVRCPQAFILHSTLLARARDRQKMRFIARLGHRLAVIFCSENQKKYWQDNGFCDVHGTVIPNGVDTNHFQPASEHEKRAARRLLALGDDDTICCMLAAFRPEKNHAALLRAVATLRREGMPLKALLIGDGPLKSAMERLARSLDIEPHVIFAGQRADVRPLLSACDIGILPSVAVETFSLAALETMSMGLPMIMTDIGGASEIVTSDANGLLIRPNDDAALSDALRRSMDASRRQSWGINARRSIASRYAQELMLQRYADVFARLGQRVP